MVRAAGLCGASTGGDWPSNKAPTLKTPTLAVVSSWREQAPSLAERGRERGPRGLAGTRGVGRYRTRIHQALAFQIDEREGERDSERQRETEKEEEDAYVAWTLLTRLIFWHRRQRNQGREPK